MKHKFEPNQLVWVNMRERMPFQIMVLEQIPDRLFYKLDWGSCGFNCILNTVSISESALSVDMPELRKKKARNFRKKNENCIA